MNSNNERFMIHKDEISIFDRNNLEVNKDMIESELQKNDLLNKNSNINIGDIVLLKYTKDIVRVEETQYCIDGIKVADYLGMLLDENNEPKNETLLFNASDIENILFNGHNKNNSVQVNNYYK